MAHIAGSDAELELRGLRARVQAKTNRSGPKKGMPVGRSKRSMKPAVVLETESRLQAISQPGSATCSFAPQSPPTAPHPSLHTLQAQKQLCKGQPLSRSLPFRQAWLGHLSRRVVWMSTLDMLIRCPEPDISPVARQVRQNNVTDGRGAAHLTSARRDPTLSHSMPPM
eukprot:358132-Chlamydomonas_euryale.AAC.5